MSWGTPAERPSSVGAGPGSGLRVWRSSGTPWREALLHGTDMGSVPVIGALFLIALVFQATNPNFLSADNLVNLSLQVSSIGVMVLGMVLVLLVGQVDLSVGAVSGLAAATVAVGSVQQGWPLWVAVVGGLALWVGYLFIVN